MTLVLDCNIWVSLTINRRLDFLVHIVESGIRLATCKTLRAELIDVLTRPKLMKFVPADSITKVAKLHDLITQTYKLNDIPKVVADSKDDYLFALCARSKADYLVSGDKIVLQAGSYGRTKTITLSELERLIYQSKR